LREEIVDKIEIESSKIGIETKTIGERVTSYWPWCRNFKFSCAELCPERAVVHRTKWKGEREEKKSFFPFYDVHLFFLGV
jgi:hypothetical protein